MKYLNTNDDSNVIEATAAIPQYPDLKIIGRSGWSGSIVATEKNIYLAAGSLIKADLGGRLIKELGSSKWNGEIAISDGEIYLAKRGELFRGKLNDTLVKISEKVASDGWDGSIAISGHYIYLAKKNGQLHRGDLRKKPLETKKIMKRGWHGSIAIYKSQIYLARLDGKLRTTDLSISRKTVIIGKVPPNSEIAVNSNYIFVVSEAKLLRYKRIVPYPLADQLKPPGLLKKAERVIRVSPDCVVGRRSEGSFLRLKDGRLVFGYSRFFGNVGDNCPSILAKIYSFENGDRWVDDELLLARDSGNTRTMMEVNLLRLKNNEIGLAYLVKQSDQLDCSNDYSTILRFRYSSDEMKSWSDPVKIADGGIINNDRLIQLSNGRLVLPFHGGSSVGCYLSDNYGRLWRRNSGGRVKPKEGGAMEPGVVELIDGRVMLWARTQLGHQYASYSVDQCENFSPMKPVLDLVSPSSPASIKRLPGSAELVCFWNRSFDPKGNRTPLSSAISEDGGSTWKNIKSIESRSDGYFAYTAITISGDSVLIGHSGGTGRPGGPGIGTIQLTRIPISVIRDS